MLRVKNKADVAEIYLSGDIVDDDEGSWIADMREGNSTGYEFPQKLREQLKAIDERMPLEIHINSCGGSVFAGMAMANFISSHKGKTTAIIDGVAASMASVIFFSADNCKMPSNSYLMLHKPMTYLEGNADELRKAADILDTLQEGIETTYLSKLQDNISLNDLKKMVNAETWMTGTDAAEKFKVEIMPPVKSLNAVGNVKKLKAMGLKIPDAVKILDESTFKLFDDSAENKGDSEVKKSDELKLQITAKREEVEKFQQAEDIDKAVKAADELNAMCDEFKIIVAKEKSDLENFLKDATPLFSMKNSDNAKLRNRAFNKLVFNQSQLLTDDERNAYFNVTGSPGAPAQIESVPAKGGYLVPQEQMKTLQEFRKEFVALKDYVSVVTTNTTSGVWATFSPQDLKFQSFAEMTDIAESDVSFGQATYVIEDKGLTLPISNQLIADADIDIISFMGRKLAEAAVRTENEEIVKQLNKLITGDTDTNITAASTITTHKALNAALFKTLDATYLQATNIFTNQDGFLWLANLDDGQDRPLMTPNVAEPEKFRYRGKEIVVLPNTHLPSTTISSKTYAPLFIGDMRSYITFFERQGMELATSYELYFRKYGTALRAVIRFGVVVTDPNAMVALKVEV